MGSGLSSSGSGIGKDFGDTFSYDMYSLPVEIIIEILSHVPAKDLINSCVLVCQMWKQLIEGHAVWKTKCLRDGKFIPPINLDPIPRRIFRNIYLKNPYGRNLIKNVSGKEQSHRNRPAVQSHLISMWRAVFHPSYDADDTEATTEFMPWIVTENGGDGWIIENPPAGADPVPGEGDQSCFATSYENCSKQQVINLIEEGVNEEILDVMKPKIVVSEWHAARFDCGSIYQLQVILMSEDKKKLDEFTYGPHKEEQWYGHHWTQAIHKFEDYPSGVRYVFFRHFGRDTQFWAGHYGSKMARASVTFDFS